MGWLYQKIGDFFTEDDGSFPEICICNLSPSQVSDGYKHIRKISSFFVGKPTFFHRDEEKEMGLDEVEDASSLVPSGKSQPFHFMVRNLKFGKENFIPEIGVFILANAIALDFEKGKIWGELEIESLLILVLRLATQSAIIKLEESTSGEDKTRFSETLEQLKLEISEATNETFL